MYILSVTHIRLKESSKKVLTAYAFERTNDWLKSWTALNNIMSVMAETKEDCIEIVCKEFNSGFLPSFIRDEGVAPEMFEFLSSIQDVDVESYVSKDLTKKQAYRFWLNSFVSNGSWVSF